MKLVSVIVPIYNTEENLEECLFSIIQQSYKNLQIILINDGSTDGSNRILHEFSNLDSRIILINQLNSGVSHARNRGLEVAKGDFIVFIDSDDYIDFNMIENLVREIEGDVDLVHFNMRLVYDNHILERKPRLQEAVYEVTELNDFIIDDGSMTGILFGSSCTAIYKNSIITNNSIRFRESITINEDGIFNIEYIMKSKKIKVIEQTFYNYRQENDNYFDPVPKICAIEKSSGYLFNEVDLSMLSTHSISNQKKNRNYSELMWKINLLCDKKSMIGKVERKKLLKKYLNDSRITNTKMDTSKLNVYKKIYYYLIRLRWVSVIILTTMYLTPILKSKVRR